ncbi:MAG TPA: hypothetical protein DHV28_09605 [Ignavibacteriales bacterium]|nr:hypothetical protein [Ignavibacteriales bacterium]
MKILQISPQISFPPDSGGRLSIYGITKSLAERGHKVTFVCYTNKPISESTINELKKICNPVFIEWKINNSIKTAVQNLFSKVPYNISKYYSKKLKIFLIDYLKHNAVDVVHVDHLHMAWIIDIIRKVSNVPVILREHNLEMKIMERYSEDQSNILFKYYSKLQFKKFLLYEPDQCRKFNRCLMVSKEDEKSLLNLNPNIKTKVIPIGVDKKIFSWHKSEDIPFSIFHLGALDWQPNYDGLSWILNEVFPKVVDVHPNSKLYVYGRGGDRLNISNNIKNNVIIKGYVENIWDEVKDKQILLVPLRVGSGMRVKIIEMLGAGYLIISTSIGKEGIDVTDGKHIFIADNSETFVKKIMDIFEKRIDAESVTKSARNIIKQKYDWENIAADLETEYLNSINEINIKA